jgi:hypothetical protein
MTRIIAVPRLAVCAYMAPDIGTLGRYDKGFDQLPRAEHPWSPLSVEEALRGLAATGLSVTR